MVRPLSISNRDARRFWLELQGFGSGHDPATAVRQAGFVQLDTLRVVARAHDHILWSRTPKYREPMMHSMLAEDRAVFEHFTHDASIIPMEFYPYWRRQFRRLSEKLLNGRWKECMPGAKGREELRKRIEREGPLCSKDFTAKGKKSKDGWIRHPQKFGLDYLWYAGVLTTSHRHNFVKYYDLTERVVPERLLRTQHDDDVQVDWLCRQALQRIGFGSEGDIQRFWDAVDLDEVKRWVSSAGESIVPLEVQLADRSTLRVLASGEIEARLAALPRPSSRMRIINPFDPLVRDRNRLKRLFGFDYRIEIFTPAAKRQYGYYVYPLLQGSRFVGRIEIRADRKKGQLQVDNLWPEPGLRRSSARLPKLEAELGRMARFVGVPDVVWNFERRWPDSKR